MIPFAVIATAVICFILGYGTCIFDMDRGLYRAAKNANLNLSRENHFHTLD